MSSMQARAQAERNDEKRNLQRPISHELSRPSPETKPPDDEWFCTSCIEDGLAKGTVLS